MIMKWIVAVGLAALVVILWILRRRLSKILTTLADIATVVSLIAMIVLIFIPEPPPKPVCFCQADSDLSTIECLIRSEAAAVNMEDLGIIEKIFAREATIYRGDTREEWTNPRLYYEYLFDTLDFDNATHTDIREVGVQEPNYYLISGSHGEYTAKDASTATYSNMTGSEHWTMAKNAEACWVIHRFEFNASHIPFPPLP